MWENEELIYYGHALGIAATIQSCLREHLDKHDPCASRATHYGWEITSHAAAREAELLYEYERARGRLPRCNAARSG